MTFSIVARCPETGQFGAAAATALPAVGKLVTYAYPGAGAVATQARLNPYLGIKGLAYLRADYTAGQLVEQLRAKDPYIEWRQFGAVDRWGFTAAYTGKECLPWAGHRSHRNFCVQGNRLVGPDVLQAMEACFLQTEKDPFPARFIKALEAGAKLGGDRHGESSATIFIVDTELYPLWDIRVDEHEKPIEELHRLYKVFQKKVVPHIKQMPVMNREEGDRGDVDV